MKILALSSVLLVFFFPLLVMSEYSLQESIRATFILFSELKTRFNASFFDAQKLSQDAGLKNREMRNIRLPWQVHVYGVMERVWID